jgi:multiple sugar transport system substrate-binding protein
VPYDDFRVKIAAAIPAGQGPDVVQLFYGWLQDYLKAGLLQPLPASDFSAVEIEREFFPIVQQMKVDGKYYAVPTAVRSLALFWNKALFKEAGLDPNRPPATLDELVDYASKLTKRSPNGDLLQEGLTIDMGGQDHHWLREVLIRQYGGVPYSADKKSVAYNTDAGVAATQWYIDLVSKQKVGQIGFLTDGVTAFRSGKAGMTIDGSFRLGALDNQKGLDYGVAELPARNNIKSNFASYWVNGITTKATGAKLDASVKFLRFLTTPEAMELWLTTVGELPARRSVAEKDANKNHVKYGPFIRGLSYSYATDFVNESAQRKVMMDMVDKVVLKNMPTKQAVAEAAVEEQKLLDGFYKK